MIIMKIAKYKQGLVTWYIKIDLLVLRLWIPKDFTQDIQGEITTVKKIMNAWFSKRLNTQWQCPLDIFTDFHYFCWPNVNSIRIHYIMMETHRKEPVIHTSHIACGWKNYFCEYKEKPILRFSYIGVTSLHQ